VQKIHSAYQQITVYQCSGRDRHTQLHSREQAHNERYLSFRLSGKPNNMSRRTTRYKLRKEIKILTYLSAPITVFID